MPLNEVPSSSTPARTISPILQFHSHCSSARHDVPKTQQTCSHLRTFAHAVLSACDSSPRYLSAWLTPSFHLSNALRSSLAIQYKIIIPCAHTFPFLFSCSFPIVPATTQYTLFYILILLIVCLPLLECKPQKGNLSLFYTLL